MCYHQAKFDMHHIYGVQENHIIKASATYRHLAGLTLIITITWTQIFHVTQSKRANLT